MMKKLLLGLAILFGGFLLSQGTAGADPAPCAIPGSDQGWYWHGDKVMQCVIDGNHMIINQYGANGFEALMLDAWVPTKYAYYWVTPSAPYGGTSIVAFCPKTWQGTHTVLTTTGAPGWEQRFDGVGGGAGIAGAINHWKFQSPPYAYTNYQHLQSGNCPYGGNATIFYQAY